MAKMQTFKFIDGDETKDIEAISFKKAVKSYQSNSKSKEVVVEWTPKKQKETYSKIQKLPLGRTKKIGR